MSAVVPTLAQLAATVAGLQANMGSMQTTIAQQNVVIAALTKSQPAISWRQPELVANFPKNGPALNGSISWSRVNGLAENSPVWVSIDGGVRFIPPQPLAWALPLGQHRVDFFLSNVAPQPELTGVWDVLPA